MIASSNRAWQDHMKRYRVAYGVGLVAIAVASAAAVAFVPPAELNVDQPILEAWESPRPFIVGNAEISLSAEPNDSSDTLVELPPDAIAFGIGEYRIGQHRWMKVQTQGGTIAWCSTGCDIFVPTAEAEEYILRQRQFLEAAVDTRVKEAVVAHIVTAGLHGGKEPYEIAITAPLDASSSNAAAEAAVSAMTTGTVLSSNKYRLDFRVTLFMHINLDHAQSSTIEVQSVEFLGQEKAAGMELSKAFSLFSKLVLF